MLKLRLVKIYYLHNYFFIFLFGYNGLCKILSILLFQYFASGIVIHLVNIFCNACALKLMHSKTSLFIILDFPHIHLSSLAKLHLCIYFFSTATYHFYSVYGSPYSSREDFCFYVISFGSVFNCFHSTLVFIV